MIDMAKDMRPPFVMKDAPEQTKTGLLTQVRNKTFNAIYSTDLYRFLGSGKSGRPFYISIIQLSMKGEFENE